MHFNGVTPRDPIGQGTSFKAFCDVQVQSGGRVNAMTYDFYGNWSAPYHNAPLFAVNAFEGQEGYSSAFNVDASMKNVIDKSKGGNNDVGCNPSDFNLGLALYGRTYANAGEFGHWGAKKASQTLGVGTYQKGVISWFDLDNRFLSPAQGGKCTGSGAWGSEHCGKWTLKRDVYAGCVPWLEKKNGDGTFDVLSFDDKYSLAFKSKYARCLGVNGLMYWDAADDQEATLSKETWQAWSNVSSSECDNYLKSPTSCPGAKGEMVCYGKPNNACDGEEQGGDGNVNPPIPPEPEPTPEPDSGESEDGDQGGEKDCSAYHSCAQSCLNLL